VNVVVDDLRFPNEAKFVKEQGGVIIQILRPDLPESLDGHASEKYWEEIDPDYVVYNEGTPDNFFQQYNRELEK